MHGRHTEPQQRRCPLPAGLAHIALALLVLLPTSISLACPSCRVGIDAREQVWTQDFGLHLGSALLPFLVVAAVSLWCEKASFAPRGVDHE